MAWQTLVIRTKTDPLSMVSAVRYEVFKLHPQQPVAPVATLNNNRHRPTYLAALGLLLTLVATATCSIPARRAACTYPSVALHRE